MQNRLAADDRRQPWRARLGRGLQGPWAGKRTGFQRRSPQNPPHRGRPRPPALEARVTRRTVAGSGSPVRTDGVAQARPPRTKSCWPPSWILENRPHESRTTAAGATAERGAVRKYL